MTVMSKIAMFIAALVALLYLLELLYALAAGRFAVTQIAAPLVLLNLVLIVRAFANRPLISRHWIAIGLFSSTVLAIITLPATAIMTIAISTVGYTGILGWLVPVGSLVLGFMTAAGFYLSARYHSPKSSKT